MTNKDVRIVLVEPNGVCRLALTGSIASSSHPISVVRVYTDVESFTDASIDFDVIVVGIPDGDKGRSVAALKARFESTPIVALSPADDGETVFAAIRSGVRALLTRDATPDDVMSSIMLVAEGGALIHPSALAVGFGWAADRITSPERRSRIDRLTKRERQVLDMLDQGLTPARISERLFLSRRTVESHLLNTYRKLGVHGQIEALNIYRSARDLRFEIAPSSVNS